MQIYSILWIRNWEFFFDKLETEKFLLAISFLWSFM